MRCANRKLGSPVDAFYEEGRRMMLRGNCLIAATVVVMGAAWAVEFSDAWAPGLNNSAVRVGMLCVASFVGLSWSVFAKRRSQGKLEELDRYLSALESLDASDLASRGENAALPKPPSHSPWREVAQRILDTLARHCQRVAELEQEKTTLDVRCRRAVSQHDRVQAILAAVNDPVVAIDDYDELLLANPAARSLFGLPDGAVAQGAVAHLIRCERLVELLLGSNHRQTAGTRAEEVEIAGPDGLAAWYRVQAAKLASADGSSTPGRGGAVAVLHDVTYQKGLQKRNAEFVSSVSHEMKTPLAGIKAYVELLADGDAEDEAQREEFLEVINSQADRLQRLVENMLNLARIEAGVVQVHKQSRPLNEILEEAVRVVGPSAEAKRIQFAMELSPLYLGILADRDMLLQAAINLLSNAVKYTPEGGRVTLRSRMDDGHVLFEVEDTGVGLSEVDSQRVFEKFYRVKKDQRMASGTGLGLPLAKHIVEDVHGGRLSVRSQLGAGSTFTAVFPSAGQMS